MQSSPSVSLYAILVSLSLYSVTILTRVISCLPFFPVSFPNPYITCQARILTREWSKRSYWHSTRVLARSGLVWSCSHLSVSRLPALCTVPNYRCEGQARSHAIREVLGIMAAVGRAFAVTTYRVDGRLKACACVCLWERQRIHTIQSVM
jgi:hypothetical protein